jgi:glycosyltransferase involved in cell wall biosynthesis
MRLLLFTDTLNDVNGVSRFIRNVGDQAAAAGRELHIITSTRLPAPADGDRPFIHNLPPRYARPMPGYPQLELAIPRRGEMFRTAARLAPDVVHVSTPGPVGTLGRRFAAMHGLPLIGTYHTDFPAYIDHLFDLPALTWMCSAHMSWFYRRFSRMFTRSMDYADSMQRLGIRRERIIRLLPGIDTAVFDARFKDEAGDIWHRLAPLGVRRQSVKVLYVGRVSIEKNLPMLTRVWPAARAACQARGIDAQLIIVGDGPYRPQMAAELAAHDAVFLGFRHGEELSTIYASSDLFIFPSTTDTLGQVVMESQCVGLPVIVTDQGGPSEVVDDGITGFVLPATPAAHGRWVQTIAQLACDAPLRQRMGEAGKAKMAPMTIRHSFDHFWQVHEQVLAEHAPGAHARAASTPLASHR